MPAIANQLRIIVQDTTLRLTPKIACVQAGVQDLVVSVDWSGNGAWDVLTLTNFMDAETGSLDVGADPGLLRFVAGDVTAQKLGFSIGNYSGADKYYAFDIVLESADGTKFVIDPVIIIKPW